MCLNCYLGIHMAGSKQTIFKQAYSASTLITAINKLTASIAHLYRLDDAISKHSQKNTVTDEIREQYVTSSRKISTGISKFETQIYQHIDNNKRLVNSVATATEVQQLDKENMDKALTYDDFHELMESHNFFRTLIKQAFEPSSKKMPADMKENNPVYRDINVR